MFAFHRAVDDDRTAVTHIADIRFICFIAHGKEDIILGRIGTADFFIGDNDVAACGTATHSSTIGRSPAYVFAFCRCNIDEDFTGRQYTLAT